MYGGPTEHGPHRQCIQTPSTTMQVCSKCGIECSTQLDCVHVKSQNNYPRLYRCIECHAKLCFACKRGAHKSDEMRADWRCDGCWTWKEHCDVCDIQLSKEETHLHPCSSTWNGNGRECNLLVCGPCGYLKGGCRQHQRGPQTNTIGVWEPYRGTYKGPEQRTEAIGEVRVTNSQWGWRPKREERTIRRYGKTEARKR